MRQRAMIAMALLFTPELIIMDEPTSALDVVGQRSLMVQIKELQEQLGFAVVFVTHDMSLVRHFSDRLLVMYAAQVAELGRTAQLFRKPLHPYTHGLLEAFPSVHGPKEHLLGIPERRRTCCVRPPVAALRRGARTLMHAAERNDRACSRSRASSSAASCTSRPRFRCRKPRRVSRERASLRAEGLTRHFRVGKLLSGQRLHAVDDVSFEIGHGEIAALVGESGSGKSTIARLLARIYKSSAGEIYFEGRPVSTLRTRRQRLAYAADVAMVFQDPYSSINPAYRITHPIERGIVLHRGDVPRRKRGDEVEKTLGTVAWSRPGASPESSPTS